MLIMATTQSRSPQTLAYSIFYGFGVTKEGRRGKMTFYSQREKMQQDHLKCVPTVRGVPPDCQHKLIGMQVPFTCGRLRPFYLRINKDRYTGGAGQVPWDTHMHATLLQQHLTLYDLIGCSPPGSYVHGILQAGILEWVAISSSRGSSNSRIKPASLTSLALQTCSLPLWLPGKPVIHTCKQCKEVHCVPRNNGRFSSNKKEIQGPPAAQHSPSISKNIPDPGH